VQQRRAEVVSASHTKPDVDTRSGTASSDYGPRERKLLEVFRGLQPNSSGVEADAVAMLGHACDMAGKCAWSRKEHERLVANISVNGYITEQDFVKKFSKYLPIKHIDFLDVIGNFSDGTPKALKKAKGRPVGVKDTSRSPSGSPIREESAERFKVDATEKPSLPTRSTEQSSGGIQGKSVSSSPGGARKAPLAKEEKPSLQPQERKSPSKKKDAFSAGTSDYMDRQLGRLN